MPAKGAESQQQLLQKVAGDVCREQSLRTGAGGSATGESCTAIAISGAHFLPNDPCLRQVFAPTTHAATES